MPTEELQVRISLKDGVTNALRKVSTGIAGFAAKASRAFASVSRTLFSLKGLLAATGAVLLTKSFISAASATENMGVRLRVLLGDVGEANALFKDLASYAGKVPFEFREIMESATMLGGIMKGGRSEIMQWMPLIGDLAAATGLGIQETSEQVMRMLSAGAASADRFRERGVLAMLGFKAGVSYSIADTKRILLEAWDSSESKIRGATDRLAETFSGGMSMIADAWFKVRDWIGGGIVKVIMPSVRGLVESFNAAGEAMPRAMNDQLAYNMAIAVGYVAEGFKNAAISALTIYKGLIKINDALPQVDWQQLAGSGAAAPSALFAQIREGFRRTSASAAEDMAAIDEAIRGLAGASYIPDEIAKSWGKASEEAGLFARIMDRVMAPAKTALAKKALAEHNAELDKFMDLWRDMSPMMGDIEDIMQPNFIVPSTFKEYVEEWKRMGKMMGISADAARSLALAMGMLDAASQRGYTAAQKNADKIRESTQQLREALAQVVQIIGTQLMQYMDDLVDGKVKRFRDYMKEIVKDVGRMAAQMAISIAMKAITAAKGGIIPADTGRFPIRAYAGGGITGGPEIAILGEGRNKEAVVPLPDNRSIPVKLQGNTGTTVNLNLTAVDQHSVTRLLFKQYPAIAAMIGRVATEKPDVLYGGTS